MTSKEHGKLLPGFAAKTNQSYLKFGNGRSVFTLFPLTPTLSRGERAGVRGKTAYFCTRSLSLFAETCEILL